MKNIYLSLDRNSYSDYKRETGKLGGTEVFFCNLEKWLIDYGYSVSKEFNPSPKHFDLVIFSNTENNIVKADKRICWAGSWHTDALSNNYDEIIWVSEYMRNGNRGIVIPAPYGSDILSHTGGKKRENFVTNRIVCNANPNKYYDHMLKVCDYLDAMKFDYHFVFCGGNKLYSSQYPECFSIIPHPRMYYRGILGRHDMIGLLSSGHVYALPAFSAKSPTFEVAPIEAMALGIPTVLADVEPYSSCHEQAFLGKNEEEFAVKIHQAMKYSSINYDVTHYSEEVIFPQVIKVIEEVIAG